MLITLLRDFLLHAFYPYPQQRSSCYAVCPWYGHHLQELEASIKMERKYNILNKKVYAIFRYKNTSARTQRLCKSSFSALTTSINSYRSFFFFLKLLKWCHMQCNFIFPKNTSEMVKLTWKIVWYGWSMAIFFTRETKADCKWIIQIRNKIPNFIENWTLQEL